jgi:hypothetical protein
LALVVTIVGYCECGHTPCDGLDCGVYFPGCAPRKKPAPKPPAVVRDMKLRGWATRRAKYGPRGHR